MLGAEEEKIARWRDENGASAHALLAPRAMPASARLMSSVAEQQGRIIPGC